MDTVNAQNQKSFESNEKMIPQMQLTLRAAYKGRNSGQLTITEANYEG